MITTPEVKLKTRLSNVSELIKLWPEVIIPEHCYFKRFDIIPEYDRNKELAYFWVEWKNRPTPAAEKTYAVVVKLKPDNQHGEPGSVAELWVERKLAKKKTLVRVLEADPIAAMTSILDSLDGCLVTLNK